MRSKPPIHFGENHHRWKGGITYDRHGYRRLLKPNHPLADSKGYVAEHRFVMCEHLGRILTSEEVVHHIDGDRQNNSLDNLQLMTHFEHKRHHALGRKHKPKPRKRVCVICGSEFISKGVGKYCQGCKTKTCKYCGKSYTSGNNSFCSLDCRNKNMIGKQPKNMTGLKLGHGWWKGKTHSHSPSGKDHWNYVERIERSCEWCHKPYKRTPNAQKKKRFCSSQCRYAWCSHRMTINNPAKHADTTHSQWEGK